MFSILYISFTFLFVYTIYICIQQIFQMSAPFTLIYSSSADLLLISDVTIILQFPIDGYGNDETTLEQVHKKST